MHFTEEQIKDLFKLKHTLASKLEKNMNENKLLEKNLEIIDMIIKEGSFIKASSLVDHTNKSEKLSSFSNYSIQINSNKNGMLIANAYITSDKISIVLEKNVSLDVNVPPFKSFFINRIIAGMKKTDIKDGVSDENKMINCNIVDDKSTLRNITITNYRRKERVNEIVNTITWSLSRMLENSN